MNRAVVTSASDGLICDSPQPPRTGGGPDPPGVRPGDGPRRDGERGHRDPDRERAAGHARVAPAGRAVSVQRPVVRRPRDQHRRLHGGAERRPGRHRGAARRGRDARPHVPDQGLPARLVRRSGRPGQGVRPRGLRVGPHRGGAAGHAAGDGPGHRRGRGRLAGDRHDRGRRRLGERLLRGDARAHQRPRRRHGALGAVRGARPGLALGGPGAGAGHHLARLQRVGRQERLRQQERGRRPRHQGLVRAPVLGRRVPPASTTSTPSCASSSGRATT